MSTIDGLTKAAMEAIRDNVIVDAHLDGDDLVLTKYDGTDLNVGVVKGPQGDIGPEGFRSIVIALDEFGYPDLTDRFDGMGVWRSDLEALFFWNASEAEWLMPHAGIPHTTCVRQPVNTTGTTDPTYQPFATDLFVDSFYKKREDSHLIITYEGAIMNNNPWGEYRVGVHVLGVTDVSVDDFYDLVDGFGDNGPKACSRQIESNVYPKGLYTFRAVRRLVNGVGEVFDGQNVDNRNSITVMETF
jgi:hypothetical protein